MNAPTHRHKGFQTSLKWKGDVTRTTAGQLGLIGSTHTILSLKCS